MSEINVFPRKNKDLRFGRIKGKTIDFTERRTAFYQTLKCRPRRGQETYVVRKQNHSEIKLVDGAPNFTLSQSFYEVVNETRGNQGN